MLFIALNKILTTIVRKSLVLELYILFPTILQYYYFQKLMKEIYTFQI